MGRNRNKTSRTPIEPSVSQQQSCYEGERLLTMLKSLQREIELAKLSNRVLPEKIWFKQQFSIGVNEVTRVLERMTPCSEMGGESAQQPLANPSELQLPSVRLQAVFVASDSNPRWLTKHLPSLASSRKVPLIFVKDKKGGSLRLGELVKLKTAIAIGIKARENGINQLVEEILHGKEVNLGTDCQELGGVSDAIVE
ncbi:hypothetical protein VitviT2T_009714 [Vitis vinifera]|uniref:Ribosomal protein eL8/eL30/eS12/Gadd45 domain-containing protein n=2 Tax=Vitis vinifera TaxID=29760 RepID=A0ABY9C855_VITVI|eukprot:XP_002273891.2 PREDICTED: uncharacterized protein LOC100255449 [Vitis vinifera]